MAPTPRSPVGEGRDEWQISTPLAFVITGSLEGGNLNQSSVDLLSLSPLIYSNGPWQDCILHTKYWCSVRVIVWPGFFINYAIAKGQSFKDGFSSIYNLQFITCGICYLTSQILIRSGLMKYRYIWCVVDEYFIYPHYN